MYYESKNKRFYVDDALYGKKKPQPYRVIERDGGADVAYTIDLESAKIIAEALDSTNYQA